MIGQFNDRVDHEIDHQGSPLPVLGKAREVERGADHQ